MKNTESGKNGRLILVITLMGLIAWSAYAASAEPGSAACQARVKDEVAALVKKNGRNPSNEVKTNLLAACSEKEVGLDLEGLFAKHRQEGTADKESRCLTSVKFVRANGLDTTGRSAEELVRVCMALPSEHDPVCGFPAGTDTYSVVENQSCVTKQAGLTTHGVVAKAEKRARKGDTLDDGQGDGGDGTGSSAQ